MRNNHQLLRTLRKQLRKDEEDEPPPTQATQLYTRLERGMRKLSHPHSPLKPFTSSSKEPSIKVTVLNPKTALHLTRSQVCKHWLQKRGKSLDSSENEVRKTAGSLYEVVDSGEGEVMGEKLIWLLVALGVGLKAEALRELMGKILGRTPIGKVKKEEWIGFCVDKSAMPKALGKLKTGTTSDGSFPSHPSSIHQLHPQITRLHSSFRHIHSLSSHLLHLWSSIDPKSTDSVSSDRVSELLVSLNCAVETRNAKEIMKNRIGESEFVSRKEFLRLFDKGILHLYIVAMGEVKPNAASDILVWTRWNVMQGLGIDEETSNGEIIKRLETLQPAIPSLSYTEYAQFISSLLLPAGYIPPKPFLKPSPSPSKPTSNLPKPIEVVTLPPPPPISLSTNEVHISPDNMQVITREDAEMIRQVDPISVQGKIVISEVRPMSEKASMRSTVTDLRVEKREKRYSLQERLLTEQETPVSQEKEFYRSNRTQGCAKPVASKPPSRPMSMTRRRYLQSRGSTAPSSVPRSIGSALRPPTRDTSSLVPPGTKYSPLRPGTTGPPLPQRTETSFHNPGNRPGTVQYRPGYEGRTLNAEFDRLVEYVPDASVGLFM